MAPKDNTNAQKFSESEAIEALESCILSLNSGESKTMQHAMRLNKITSGLKHYWKSDRFKDNNAVLDAIKRLEYEGEDSLFIGGADGEIPPNLCMFGLKVINGWVEKGEADKTEVLKRVVTTRVVAPIGMQERIEAIREDVKAKHAAR